MSVANKIIIYTDGSSLGNPGPGGFGAVIWLRSNTKGESGEEKKDEVFEIGERSEGVTTNNRMEIMAAIEALLAVEKYSAEVTIYTDSEYLLNGITKWIFNWQKKGWKTAGKKPVLNQDLWQRLLLLSSHREKIGGLKWRQVTAHTGILGNERADTIATSFAEGKDVTFARGTREEYEKLFSGKLEESTPPQSSPFKGEEELAPPPYKG